MSDIKNKYGEFGCDLLEALKAEARQIVAEMVEPVHVLKDFETVEVLTLDEACRVLRCDRQKLRDACRRGEVPFERLGRDLIFPKRTLVTYLCGEWRPPAKGEKENSISKSNDSSGKIRDFVN
jgi:excisionase family DNA binding protein